MDALGLAQLQRRIKIYLFHIHFYIIFRHVAYTYIRIYTCIYHIIAHKIEMDALGLAQLQRRIKDETRRKSKLRAREKENSFGYLGGKDRGVDPYPGKRGLFDGTSNLRYVYIYI
jgi:hypothetical protein